MLLSHAPFLLYAPDSTTPKSIPDRPKASLLYFFQQSYKSHKSLSRRSRFYSCGSPGFANFADSILISPSHIDGWSHPSGEWRRSGRPSGRSFPELGGEREPAEEGEEGRVTAEVVVGVLTGSCPLSFDIATALGASQTATLPA